MAALQRLDRQYLNAVGRESRLSVLGEFIDLCPYDTGLVVGRFQNGVRADVVDAVRIATDAVDSWERTRVGRRCDLLKGAADELASRKFEFSAWLTLENGKNRFEAMAEVDEAIDYLRFYPKLLREQEGYVLELDGPVPCDDARSVLRSLGVVGVISPFNFPLAITAGMVTGALATGNAVVLKPPSDAPLMGYLLRELLVKNGIPPEVFHFVAGPGNEVGSELVNNSGVSVIAFTGSREVGLNIARRSVELGKRPPILEMGGKNPVIVSDKANLERAVEGVARSAFGYSGQKCSATSRVIVSRAVADKFMLMLAEWVREIRIGNPSARDVYLGPVINGAAVDRFMDAVVRASASGLVVAGGHVLGDGQFGKGHFVEPTVVAHLGRDDELAHKELFLPLLVVLTYSHFDEAIDIANSVEYGLTAGIFSDDPGEVQEFFTRIKAGVTYANRSQGASTGALVGSQPFTGWKSSGVTGKGAGGSYYLLQFLQEQSRTVCR